MPTCEVPALDEFRSRFPVFSAANDGLVGDLIKEATRFVDTSWFPEDYKTAIKYLVAHMLTMEGHLPGGPNSAAATGGVTSEKLGDATRTYSGAGASGDGGPLDAFRQTQFGRRYLDLLRANKPAVVVIS